MIAYEQDLPANGSRCTSDTKPPRQHQTAFSFWIRITSLTVLRLAGFLILMQSGLVPGLEFSLPRLEVEGVRSVSQVRPGGGVDVLA